MLRACRSARDRFIVTAMARAGLRRGEVTGLRREDMHLVADAPVWAARSRAASACPAPGQPNGAWAKSRRSRPVPVDDLLVLAMTRMVRARWCRQPVSVTSCW